MTMTMLIWIDLKKKMYESGKLHELAYKEPILSINNNFSVAKLAFGLVRNTKSLEFTEGKYKIL